MPAMPEGEYPIYQSASFCRSLFFVVVVIVIVIVVVIFIVIVICMFFIVHDHDHHLDYKITNGKM